MPHIITQPCEGVKDTACVEVCPVDCIHPREDEPDFDDVPHLYIHPEECIDCGACVAACPAGAVYREEEVPEKWKNYIGKNYSYYGVSRKG